jgi:hypothetical protein
MGVTPERCPRLCPVGKCSLPRLRRVTFGRRRWEYDFNVSSVENVERLKEALVKVVRSVEGVLPEPPPEVFCPRPGRFCG